MPQEPPPPPDTQVVTLKHPDGLIERATRHGYYGWEQWEPRFVGPEHDLARKATLLDYERGDFGPEGIGGAKRRQRFAEMPPEIRQGLQTIVYLEDIGLYCWLTNAQIVQYEVEGILEPEVEEVREQVARLRQLLPQHVAITPDDIEFRKVAPWKPPRPGERL